MTICDETQILLGPFADGELRSHQMEEVAFHVVGCDSCRAALDDFRSLGVAIRGVTTLPALDGFTRAVMARIDHERPPIRIRLREFWESLGRIGAVIQVAGVAAVSTALILMVLEPRVKNDLNRPVPIAMATQTRPIAMAAQTRVIQIPAISTSTAPDASGESDEADAVAARDSQNLVSALGGGSGPSVAVWDEPRTGTTVVWVPDQQP